MVRRDFLLSLLATAMVRPCMAADPALAGVKRIAVVPLVGNVIRVVHDGQRTAPQDENPRREEFLSLDQPAFDYFSAWAADAALRKALPGVEPLKLQMSMLLPEMDPGSLARGIGALQTRLENEGIVHVLTISRRRGPAQFDLGGKKVGSGDVEGIGFYVNRDPQTIGGGYIAAHAYLKLAIVEAASGRSLHESVVTTHRARSAGDPDAFGPWEKMTVPDQVAVLRPLIDRGVADTVPTLVGAPCVASRPVSGWAQTNA